MAKDKLNLLRTPLTNIADGLWEQVITNETTLRREAIARLLNAGKDINYECGYPDTIGRADYRSMYEREGIAKRVVRILPEESWQTPPSIYETEDSKETQFEKAWDELNRHRQVLQYLQRADVLSGIGRFGVLLLGVDDGKALNEPVDGIDPVTGETSGKNSHKLNYLKALDESYVTVDSKEGDVTSPRYDLPKLYGVTFESETASSSTKKTAKVHWSRVIHVADNRGMSETMGRPRMESVYNRLLDLRKVLSGSGEMFWKGGFPGYAAELDPAMSPDLLQNNVLREEIMTALKEQIELYQNSLQRIIALAGMKFKSLQPQVADPKGHVETHLKAIAISLGIPYRIFMGSEEAKLASSQDVRTWNKRLKNRQSQYLTPMLIRPTVDRLIAYGALPEPKQGYFVEWPDLDALSDEEVARIAKDKTEAAAKYVTGDVAQVISPKHFLTLFLGMSDEQAQAVAEEAGAYDKDEPEEGE